MIKFFIASLLALLIGPYAMGIPREVDRQHLEDGRNLMLNPGIESGRAGYSITGSGTLTLESGAPLLGKRSLKWNPSATGEFLNSTAVSIPKKLRGNQCLLKFDYLWDAGVATEINYRVYDGSADVTAAIDLEKTSGTVREAFVIFTCPVSGTVQLRMASTADAQEVTLDSLHLGSNVKSVQVGSAELIVNAKYQDAGCLWTRNNTAFGAFAPDADCGPIQVAYSSVTVDTTDNDLPDLVLPNLGPGRYKVVAYAGAFNDTGAALMSMRISDGTLNGYGHGINVSTAGSQRQDVVVEGVFEYTDSGTRTFSLQGLATAGAIAVAADADSTLLGWTVEKFPLGSTNAVSVDSSPLFWSGHHDFNCSWSRTSGVHGDPTPDASCSLTTRESKNFGTVVSHETGGSALPGIRFTPKRAAEFYVCANLEAAGTDSSGLMEFRLLDNSTSTIIAEQSVHVGVANKRYPVNLCSIYRASSVTVKNLTIQTNASVGTVTIAGAQTSIEWTVIELSSGINALQLNNMVSSSSSSGTKMVSARIDNSGVPAVGQQDGSWIASISDDGVGDMTLTLVADTFSSPPVCTCTTMVAGRACGFNSNPTSSSIPDLQTYVTSTAANIDVDLNIICVGLK